MAYVNECGDKRFYSDYKEAEAALKRLRKHDDVENKHILHAYRCSHCPYWHLGHNKKGFKA